MLITTKYYWESTGKQDHKFIGDPVDGTTSISFIYWFETTPFFWCVVSLPGNLYHAFCTDASKLMKGTRPIKALNQFRVDVIDAIKGLDPKGALTDVGSIDHQKLGIVYHYVLNGALVVFYFDPAISVKTLVPSIIYVSSRQRGKGVVHGLLDTLTETVGVLVEADNLTYDDKDVSITKRIY